MKIIGLLVFFGLCLGAFHFLEGHKSTEYKDRIAELEDRVKHLRSENTEIVNDNNDMQSTMSDMQSSMRTLVMVLNSFEYQWTEKFKEQVDKLIGEQAVAEAGGV